MNFEIRAQVAATKELMHQTVSERRRPASRKRSRIPLACDICRARKVRCDGVKPTCSQCQKRGLRRGQCIYGIIDSYGRNDSQRAYIRALHDRINALEEAQGRCSVHEAENPEEEVDAAEEFPSELASAQCRPSQPGLNDGNITKPATLEESSVFQVRTDLSSPSSQRELSKDHTIPIQTYGFATSSPVSTNGTRTSKVRNVNAMGAMFSTMDNPQTDDDSLYGRSSIVSLANQIQHDQDQEESHSRVRPFTLSLQTPNAPQSTTTTARIRRFSLPSRSDADHLLDQFWRNFHLFYPWIHFPSFLKAYERLWISKSSANGDLETSRVGLGGSGCSQTVLHCALNVMFALGCEFSNSTEQDGENPGAEFMNRANELFSINLLGEEGLSVVQTLLLLSIYLQSTQNPQQCWGVAGLALRMAQGIGLHHEQAFMSLNTLEIEMRRRVWHGCLLLDRIVSVSLGRLPTPTGSVKVPMFSAVDDEYLEPTSEPCKQPESTFSRVVFAVSQCQLSEILSQIQEVFYGQGVEDQTPLQSTTDTDWKSISCDIVMALEDSLGNFETNLPTPLSWQNETPFASQSTSPAARQRLSIRTKLLHARIMLYRSFLINHKSSKNGHHPTASEQTLKHTNYEAKSMRSIFAAQCATKCFRAASELVEVLHQATLGQFYGAWWYGVFYLMTACTVLIISETTPHVEEELNEGSLARLWSLADEILDILKAKHHMAAQCADALQELRAKATRPQRFGSVDNATNIQLSSIPGIGPNGLSSLSQTLESADKDAYNIDWMIQGQNLASAALFDNEWNQGLYNEYSAFWPVLHGLQGSLSEATHSNTT